METGLARGIQERSFEFGVRVLKLVRALPRDIAGQVVGRQLARAGTGIGANVEGAQAAESRRDFTHKLAIARKEARESLFWLRMTHAAGLLPALRLSKITDESDALVRILTASVRKLATRTAVDVGRGQRTSEKSAVRTKIAKRKTQNS